jgi:hypothetical protein
MQNHHAKCSVVETLVFVTLIVGFASGVWSDEKKGPEKKGAEKSVAIPKMSVKDAPVVIIALCTDGSNLKLTVLDKQIRLKTRFGILVIPVAEIHRIEVATRIPADDSKIIDARILELGSTNYKERKAATEALHRFGRKAYPTLLKITDHLDLEVAVRAKNLIKDLEDEIPEELLKVRDRDVIHTVNSKISGWIKAEDLNVRTAQFGEQKLRL